MNKQEIELALIPRIKLALEAHVKGRITIWMLKEIVDMLHVHVREL